MATDEQANGAGRGRLSPADVHSVMFSRASMVNRGYDTGQVDDFLDRVEGELARLVSEKAQLRDEVSALRAQVRTGADAPPESPTVQAVRVLSAAQQTADQYVADAEQLSRHLSVEAREQYEEVLRQAKEEADAIVRRAEGEALSGARLDAEELRAQTAYLQAFGQACRTQLRAYLEALLTDVEAEWGRAAPAAVPAPPAQETNGRSVVGARPRPEEPAVTTDAALPGREAGHGDAAANGARQEVVTLPR